VIAAPAVTGPLAAYTTLRLGGPAGQVVVGTDENIIIQTMRYAARRREPVLVLAGGSNVVISDAGFPGTVVLVRSRGMRVRAEHADAVTITVAAGETWDDVVRAAIGSGWSGLECLSGVPGSAGATPIQNVGAYGQEVAETITSVRAYDRLADKVVTLAPAECGFVYRGSIFKYADRWVVLSVDFRLPRSPLSAPVRYAELARVLGVGVGDRVPMVRAREAVLALRAGKGMVLDPADPDTYSVGSFFTNPVLGAAAYDELLACTDGLGDPPAWPGPDGTVKVSAAWLIERAGFTKGYGPGDVTTSTKHTLALTNRGTGTTKALLALAAEIRDGVRDQFGVTLHPEPVLVNCAL
jgi:UDP-N-acetylmuramate dehydrogenase